MKTKPLTTGMFKNRGELEKEIIRLMKCRYTQEEVGERCGCCQSVVSKVWARKKIKHQAF